MAREQELLLEEFTRFVGVLDGRNDLTIQQAKSWTMDELMESIHPVSFENLVQAVKITAQALPTAPKY